MLHSMFRTASFAVCLCALIACGDSADDAGATTSATTGSTTGTGGASAGGAGAGAGGSGMGGMAAVTRTDVVLTTSDGLNLTGYVTAGGVAGVGAPGVVLVHQFQRDDVQWGDLPEALAAAGYRTLAFNLRGHGDSDPYGGPLSDLLTDPNGAPRDVDAAVAYLSTDGGADAARIAVVGTSIGANLAVASAVGDKAKTYVALSARQPPTMSLANAPVMGMRSVFYLAAENDPGGQAADSQTMFDATADPREIHIYPGTADHGIAILDNQTDSRDRVLTWLAANL